MARPEPWNEGLVLEAVRLKEKGLTWSQIGNILGKSKSSCQSAVARYQGKTWTKLDRASGEPIGLEMTDIAYRDDAEHGSRLLAEACNLLIGQMRPMQVSALGLTTVRPTPHSPSSPAILRGQAAERKLAA